MIHFIYDSGALIAAAKNDRTFLGRHSRLLARDIVPLVPAGVLAQCWDTRAMAANLHRVLRGCRVLPLTEPVAKAAAILCQKNGSTDVVDASVVLASLAHECAPILTDDLGDIKALLACMNRGRVKVERP
ncbi:twitching motility protein PilT [Streptomyces sp. BPTC-684]|uniref:twitching motility protein PilT n=1 Tax=Streptomyces sp. BPTC-684 TaxID=3043734 RepID=UPI0024B0CCE6|nr:twitching motility protein PilT [Streptomyces sp. BPTC-684]WHM37991.1 twitching motility protein PilT [Streptomyces sp. BPTC-684]